MRLILCALGALLTLAASASPAPQAASYIGPGPFRCASAIDYDLVRVTPPAGATYDAVSLGRNCSGRIGRLEVYIARGADGLKVQNVAPVAHDFVIESGSIVCDDMVTGAHQDGVQAMGGYRISARNLFIDCQGNAQWFMAKGGSGGSTPTDVVCDGCVFGPGANSELFIADSLRSGARNSYVCGNTRITSGAIEPVNVNNQTLPASDPICGGAPAPPPPPPEPPPPPAPEPPPPGGGLG